MTERWVSQGNHWCDCCRIFIADNINSRRLHESGAKHKEALQKKLLDMRKRQVLQEREQKQVEMEMKRIDEQARAAYEKDLAAMQPARGGAQTAQGAGPSADGRVGGAGHVQGGDADGADGWVQEPSTGYYYNAQTGYYYDANSGLYCMPGGDQWTTMEECQKLAATTSAAAAPVESRKAPAGGPPGTKPTAPAQDTGGKGKVAQSAGASTKKETAEVIVVTSTASKGPAAAAKPTAPATLKSATPATATAAGSKKGVAATVTGVKRKPEDSKELSEAEKAAIAAREAARERVTARHQKLFGIY
eukprot:jgi/Mesvir1/28707/Mv19678-RA.1